MLASDRSGEAYAGDGSSADAIERIVGRVLRAASDYGSSPRRCHRQLVLTRDHELWGAASMLLRQYGDAVDDRVAQRLRALALAGDEKGVALWRDLAARIDQLRERNGQAH